MPGVVAVLTGDDLAADKIGNLICGWMIHSKDGSPMKMAPHPAIAAGKVSYVGDAYAVVIAETAGAGQGRGGKNRRPITKCCRRCIDPAKAQSKGAQQIHEVAPNNTIYEWHIGDPDANRRRVEDGQARHQARLHQQSPGAERDGAARRDRRIRCRQ